MQPIHHPQGSERLSQIHGASPEEDTDDEAPTMAPIALARTNTARAIEEGQPPFLRRVLTLGRQPATVTTELTLSMPEVQAKVEKEFLKWLLDELTKCERFYAEREKEVVQRYDDMYEQLDVMRDRWFRSKHNIPFEEDDAEESTNDSDTTPTNSVSVVHGAETQKPRRRPAWKSVTEAMNGLTKTNPSKTSVVNEETDKYPQYRDYERRRPTRKPSNDPPHRVAKRKLKKAYIEYYHGLEMLKSYITINREAFRKITKKFDKASGLRTSHRFMTEYVDKSYFGGPNNKLDDLMNDTENLFAKFFERGNRKEASQKLRSREHKSLHHASILRSGLSLGASVIIAAYALYTSVGRLHDKNNPDLAMRTSYLLQVRS
ncbi:hypothetical protein EX30DRAFT_207915 [Ascodesmis nigricans]|uniref:SPX domain-containing protein n=1 Tax=Ascodesmis nigricans TaxID=341454 RepID=A0A4S2MR19_9PEZI|nr:hypothetical protein EX30DRAFT_207915 [Ascodesmis nigricans]